SVTGLLKTRPSGRSSTPQAGSVLNGCEVMVTGVITIVSAANSASPGTVSSNVVPSGGVASNDPPVSGMSFVTRALAWSVYVTVAGFAAGVRLQKFVAGGPP